MDKEIKNKKEVNIRLFLPLLFLYISLPFISNMIVIGIIFILIVIAIIRPQVFIEQKESQNKGI